MDTDASAGRLAAGEKVREYRIVRLLGAGGMGEVYEAVHELTSARCALKRMLAEFSQNSTVEQRFVEEARIMSLLEHPNIVPLQTFFKEDGRFCLVMKFIDGTTLKDLVASLAENDRILPVERAVALVAPIARALHHAHKLDVVQFDTDEQGRRVNRPTSSVIHRDVKPSNIMVDRSDHPYLTDFGIAKADGGKSLTRTGAVIGTYEYMSPEQIQGKHLSSASDQYSLGATLYSALAGQAPFPQTSTSGFECMQGHVDKSPPPMSKFRIDMPKTLDAVLLKAMHKDPARRFRSCAEFADAMEAAVKHPAQQVVVPAWGRVQEPKPVYGPPPDDDDGPAPVYGPSTGGDDDVKPVYGPPDTSELTSQGFRSGRSLLPWILAGVAVVVAVVAVFALGSSKKEQDRIPASREIAVDSPKVPEEKKAPEESMQPEGAPAPWKVAPAKPQKASDPDEPGPASRPDGRRERPSKTAEPSPAPPDPGPRTPDPAPKAPPPPSPRRLEVQAVTASDWNYRNRDPGKYRPDNLVDGAASTAWCKTDGIGESVTIKLSRPAVVHELRILNGYQKVASDKYGDRFSRNSRVARFSLSRAYGEPEGSFTLDDSKVWRKIELAPFRTDRISLTVESAYWGKDRSVCLSEVEVWGVEE